MKNEEFQQSTPVSNDLASFKTLSGATDPDERINEIRLGVRKTIEFLNQPYVKYVLEKRGVNVNEKLAQLRGRFSVLAKYPTRSKYEAHFPLAKEQPTQFAMLNDQDATNNSFNNFLESAPVTPISGEDK